MNMPSYDDLNIDYKGGDLLINMQSLNSLAGLPEHITGNLLCIGNQLTSLVGGPQKVDGSYDISHNYELTSLIGCASHIGNRLDLENNPITSLIGIHKIIKSCRAIDFNNDKISEGGIGLLLIERLTYITYSSNLGDDPFEIIKSYLGSGTKGMMDCRAELIEKGYENYAKL